ncbi:MAG: glycosyltransferase family 2 protein [bacterium]|nr:glycosyltransferase family 2 protein [bacterium]
MPKISVVINTLNEEANLPRALASVKSFADEIIVVDMKSDDKTQEIAKKAGAKFYEFKRVGYVEPARNFAISKAEGDWIFILDADEELTASLARELSKIAKKGSADYVRIPRKNIVFGKQLKNSRWWPDYNIRFFKKGKVTWDDEIHSIPITEGKGMDLESKEENAIIHYHYVTITQFVERMNRYTDIQSKSLVEKGYKFSWKDLLAKPSGEFFSRYFFGAGYKDGLHGLALSLLQFLSELVLYLKVWQAEGFKEENPSLKEVIKVIRENEKDGHYWQADALVKKGGIGSIPARLKRKFKLA